MVESFPQFAFNAFIVHAWCKNRAGLAIGSALSLPSPPVPSTQISLGNQRWIRQFSIIAGNRQRNKQASLWTWPKFIPHVSWFLLPHLRVTAFNASRGPAWWFGPWAALSSPTHNVFCPLSCLPTDLHRYSSSIPACACLFGRLLR